MYAFTAFDGEAGVLRDKNYRGPNNSSEEY
jgi:hypothetical protein